MIDFEMVMKMKFYDHKTFRRVLAKLMSKATKHAVSPLHTRLRSGIKTKGTGNTKRAVKFLVAKVSRKGKRSGYITRFKWGIESQRAIAKKKERDAKRKPERRAKKPIVFGGAWHFLAGNRRSKDPRYHWVGRLGPRFLTATNKAKDKQIEAAENTRGEAFKRAHKAARTKTIMNVK